MFSLAGAPGPQTGWILGILNPAHPSQPPHGAGTGPGGTGGPFPSRCRRWQRRLLSPLNGDACPGPSPHTRLQPSPSPLGPAGTQIQHCLQLGDRAERRNALEFAGRKAAATEYAVKSHF